MARIARVVAPGRPHLVIQRGNRQQPTFFSDDDFGLYKTLVGEFCAKAGVAIWAYSLMPNHVNLLLVPDSETGLQAALGEAHRRYTRHINTRENWRGYLWQGRFASFPLDDPYVDIATRYVELNPVRARLVKKPKDWVWSSARAHLKDKLDGFVDPAPLRQRFGAWKPFLNGPLEEADLELLRAHERTGRPLGDSAFVTRLESQLGRSLKKNKPGPKPKARPATTP
ncbi:transposase [Magnetospira thiophila]